MKIDARNWLNIIELQSLLQINDYLFFILYVYENIILFY